MTQMQVANLGTRSLYGEDTPLSGTVQYRPRLSYQLNRRTNREVSNINSLGDSHPVAGRCSIQYLLQGALPRCHKKLRCHGFSGQQQTKHQNPGQVL